MAQDESMPESPEPTDTGSTESEHSPAGDQAAKPDAPSPGPSPVARRGFLAAAAGSLAAAACGPGGDAGGSAAVQTGQRVQWRLASAFPRSIDTLFGSCEVLAQSLSDMTGGRFTVRVHPAGEVVPALQVMDAAQQGTVQVAHSPSYYFLGKNQVLAFDTCVPFGLTTRQQTAWLHQGGGLELFRELYSDFGIRNFVAGNTGTQMGGWFRREIEGLSDVRGLKIRIPGLGGQVMDRLGATVQVLAAGDIYPALERGTIDATEWVGPYDDERLGLHKAAQYYYYPGWWEPGPSMSFLVNQQAWDRLPVDYQHAFEVATFKAAAASISAYDAKNPPALRRLVDGGVQLRRFSDEVLAAARTTTEEMLEEQAAADASYRRVYDAFKTFREDSFGWFGTAELAYASFAYGDR